jgi:hypothetical protein
MEAMLSTVGDKQQPYSSRKRKVLFYRITFAHLGAILLLLSSLIFLRNPNWAFCDLYLGYCWLLKGIVGSFSGLLGVSAILIATNLKAESEVAFQIWHAGKQRLYRLYLARLAGAGGSRFSSVVDGDPEVRRLRGNYLRTKDTLLEQKHLTLALLRQIISSSSLGPMQKEELMNDALIEFEKKTSHILTCFAEDRSTKN